MTREQLEQMSEDEFDKCYASVCGGGYYEKGAFQYLAVGGFTKEGMISDILKGTKRWQDFGLKQSLAK